ncbi:MAG: hypothetical protein KF716_23505 [Anaerolineae bacterium]|nr:hypothetical protein [Anaerolineae bacterium]
MGVGKYCTGVGGSVNHVVLDGYFDAWFDRNCLALAGLLSFWLIVGVVLLFTRSEAKRSATNTLWQETGSKRVRLGTTLIVLIIVFFDPFRCERCVCYPRSHDFPD